MSEYSIQLWSQRPGVDFSIDSGEPSVNIHSSSQVEREVNQKPRFAEFACPPGEVRTVRSRNNRQLSEGSLCLGFPFCCIGGRLCHSPEALGPER